MSEVCQNCGASLREGDKFCFQCGQSTKSLQRPFFSFIRESLHELFDIDGRLWLTLKTLVMQPGVAALEYSQGKRTKYTPALRLYLVISLLFFLFFSALQGISPDNRQYSESAVDMYSKAMFVLFPVFAALVGLLFRNSYYLASLVFSMHIHSIAYVVLAIMAPLEKIQQSNWVVILLQSPAALYFVWYVLRSFKVMYSENWLATVGKTALIYIIYMAIMGFVFDILL